MKTRWSALFCAVAAVGFAASQAQPGVELVVHAKLAPGDDGIVTPTDGNVWLRVYAYVLDANGTYASDGISTLYGALRSSNGRLLGDLSFSLKDPNFTRASASSDGTAQDLDGDTDLDVGGKNGDVQGDPDGFWIAPNVAGGKYQSGVDSNAVLLGTALFHMTAVNPPADSNTVVAWYWRYKPTVPSEQNAYKIYGTNKVIDGNTFSNAPGDPLVGADQGVNIVFVPEPVTLSLLAAGGAALVALRRRRSR